MHLATITQKITKQMAHASVAQKITDKIKHFYSRQIKDEEYYISEVLQHPSRPSVLINNLDERRFIIGLDHYYNKGRHRH